MEAARYSVTSGRLYQETRRHIPQNSTIQGHSSENLRKEEISCQVEEPHKEHPVP